VDISRQLPLSGNTVAPHIKSIFRFALRADAVAASGTVLPEPGWAVRAFRGGLVDKPFAKDRLWLGILTLVLLGSSRFIPALERAANAGAIMRHRRRQCQPDG